MLVFSSVDLHSYNAIEKIKADAERQVKLHSKGMPGTELDWVVLQHKADLARDPEPKPEEPGWLEPEPELEPEREQEAGSARRGRTGILHWHVLLP